MVVELFLGGGLSLLAAHLYRFSRRRARLQPTGPNKAASLLFQLPKSTALMVLRQLDPALNSKLAEVAATLSRFPPESVGWLAQEAMGEVFLELGYHSGMNHTEAWTMLCQNEPALAAGIFAHLCSTPDKSLAGS